MQELEDANPPPTLAGSKTQDATPPKQPTEDTPLELPERGPQECAADHIINPKALEYYGYTDESMLPLSKDRAMELFARDVPVYLIYRNNTEALAFEPEEILEHDGLFGVTREDWAAVKADIPPRDLEQKLRDSTKDTFVIYHLNNDQRERMFQNYEDLVEAPAIDQYHPVYIGELPAAGETGATLENLFQTFNLTRPADYTFHSLSVSDIVALKQNGVISYHYCDSAGFQQLQNFVPQENYLRNAEMAVEDDYGMIDGIINNGPRQPTVAELESQVKAGQPISLLDLANAAQAEARAKKPSILERLKKPVEQQEPSKPKQQRQRNDAERSI